VARPTRFKTLAALRAVFANHDLRRVEFAWVLYVMARWGTRVAILVFAYERGGAAETGFVSVVQLVPAAIVAPFVAVLGDRFRRDRTLVVGYFLQTVSIAAVAAAMYAEAPGALTYALTGVMAATMTVTRPVQSALLPQLTRSPEELIAANVVAGSEYGAMTLIGPAAAGALIAVSGEALATGFFAGLTLLAAVLVLGLSPQPHAEPSHEHRPLEEAAAGFRAVAEDPNQRLVVGLLVGLSFTAGALDVLTIVIGLGVLGLPAAAAGYLAAARGGGGLLGGIWTLGLVGKPRLAAALMVGLLVYAVSTAGLAFAVVAALAYLCQVAAGAGYARADMSGRTLLQRLVPNEVMARVFGVLEGVNQAGHATGALVAPLAVTTLGVRGGTVAIGLVLPAAIAILLPRIRAIDLAARIPEREVAILRSVDLFAPLRPHTFERIASHLTEVPVTAGSVIVREGEPGDRFYVVADGEVEVTQDGRAVATLGPGRYFGEIALIRNVPRTATVTAKTPALLLALERHDFLEAVTGHRVHHDVLHHAATRAPKE
jgi:MFS family permease